MASIYPARLLPQPNYLLVGGDQVLSGAVARRTPTHLPLLGEDGKILVGQLSSPTEDIARGFSVNLLGQFQIGSHAVCLLAGGGTRFTATSGRG